MKRIIFLSLIFCFAGIKVITAQNEPAKPVDIIFEKTIIDLGEIKHGEDAIAVFIYKNTSKKPLALTNVRATCGCTVAEWSKEPVKRRKKGTITVNYDSRRVGAFNKSIRVFTDRQENPIQLQIKGKVLPPESQTKKQ
ncbi:MAG: DUF1573 domain-containing protein [Bacteroidales bacterium]|nr:DUF1573 domain-containing protein [Bacteroidales bacterium]